MYSLKKILLKKVVDLKTEYSSTQRKKWVRVTESFAVLLGVFCSSVVLYYIYFLPELAKTFPKTLKFIVWAYIIVLIPIAFLLYKESSLNRIERFSIVMWVLLSMMTLMLVVLVSARSV